MTYRYVPPGAYAGARFYGTLRRPKSWFDPYLPLAAVALELADRRRTSEGWVYRLVGERVFRPDLLASGTEVADPHDVRLVVRVTDEGLIRSYRFTYEGRVDGRAVRVVRRVEFSGVGTTTVERPPWYDEAVNASDTGG